MKIIVLADTHSRPLPMPLMEALEGADMIAHAGDFCDADVYSRLKRIKDMHAVCGNVDSAELRKILPQQDVFECGGVRIALAHGEGSYDMIIPRLQELFKGQGVQVVIFGHSHVPYNERIEGVLFFNPGSPTDTVRSPYLSYGVIEADAGKVKARIVKLRNL